MKLFIVFLVLFSFGAFAQDYKCVQKLDKITSASADIGYMYRLVENTRTVVEHDSDDVSARQLLNERIIKLKKMKISQKRRKTIFIKNCVK